MIHQNTVTNNVKNPMYINTVTYIYRSYSIPQCTQNDPKPNQTNIDPW